MPSDHWDWEALRREARREARRLLDPVRAEDAAQEALVRAFRHRDRCRDPGRPLPWVRAIARREALRALAAPVAVADEPDAGAVIEPHASSAERAALRAALRSLPHTDQRIVLLRYWGDMTEAQIAQELAMPVGTVKTRLHRARAALRRDLAASFGD